MRATSIALSLLAVPAATVALWAGLVVAGDRTDRGFFAVPPLRNSAEAAAAGDAASMLYFMRLGNDPRHVYPIRPDLISTQVLQATTVEAAMWARRLEMIRLLDLEQAIAGGDQRQQLACLAADLDMPDVVAYLGSSAGCVRGDAVARVIARSNPELER